MGGKERTRNFNPRTYTGCDVSDIYGIVAEKVFQSTHLHGVRHVRHWVYMQDDSISIHAPTRGATRLPLQAPFH